jgi:methylenetetrahydrofolate dehydrogenase (NADP+) / methenyltetrahydrofolate cyclohydrolase
VIYSNQILAQEFQEFLQVQRQKIKTEIALNIIQIGENLASQKYIKIKQNFGQKIGIPVYLHKFELTNSDKENQRIVKQIKSLLEDSQNSKNGLIFQLPVPLEFSQLVKQTPVFCDVDLLSSYNSHLWNNNFLPPTVGAIDLVLKQILMPKNFDKALETRNFIDFLNLKIDFGQKIVTIVGQGNLVGSPLLEYFKNGQATILSLNKFSPNAQELTKKADILISAAGQKNLITRNYLNPKSIIIDASTSESDGKLVGDVVIKDIFDSNILCTSPKGIGKITVCYLFWNLMKLKLESEKLLDK